MEVIKLIKDLTHFPVPIGHCINWIENPGNIHTFAMQCPNCGHAFCLVNHKIEDGVVSPSVVCPYGCGYHVMMRISYGAD